MSENFSISKFVMLSLLTVHFLGIINVTAQDNEFDNPEEKERSIGITGGVGASSSIIRKDTHSSSLRHGSAATFFLGVNYRNQLTKKLTFSVLAEFRQNAYTATHSRTQNDYTYHSKRMFNFLSLPVALDYLLTDNDKFSTFAGAGIAGQYLLNSMIQYEYRFNSGETDYFRIFHSGSEYSRFSDNPFEKRLVFTGEVHYGVKWKLSDKQFIISQLRYLHDIDGMTNYFYSGRNPLIFHSLSLSIGYFKTF